MTKKWKIFGITMLSLALISYLSFLLILPNIDINIFKPEVQKIAKEQAKLDINFENAKIWSSAAPLSNQKDSKAKTLFELSLKALLRSSFFSPLSFLFCLYCKP